MEISWGPRATLQAGAGARWFGSCVPPCSTARKKPSSIAVATPPASGAAAAALERGQRGKRLRRRVLGLVVELPGQVQRLGADDVHWHQRQGEEQLVLDQLAQVERAGQLEHVFLALGVERRRRLL